MVSPPTRTEFLRSRFYRCAMAYNKRNEQRLKNIRDLLEKVDLKTKRSRASVKKRYVSSWKIPDCNGSGKNRRSKEDKAILSADSAKSDFVYDETKREYSLTLGGVKVMQMPKEIFDRLKPFQRDAVKWIAAVGPTGGLLADDMGLGKTFMSIAGLGAQMRLKLVKMALIVAPVSVLGGWAEEGKKFLPKFAKHVRVVKVHGANQKDRQKTVRNAWKDASYDRPYIIISSWGLVASARTMKTFLPPSGHSWDYVVLDEAHEIRNHASNRSKCCRRICFKSGTRRLLLTGTPFQNNTNELWSIVNMATAGKILGKLKEFNKTYGKPIKDARCRNASSYMIKQGQDANEKLQETLKPYVLRRRKMDCLSNELPPKLETCVWVKPSKQQQKMYKAKVEENGYLAENILSSDKELANKAKMGAFQVLAQLKNLCGHPLRLLAQGHIRSALEQTQLKTILDGSKKLELVVHMLKGFKADDKKTLLFSQSTQNLDVIQHVLLQQGALTICRLDGSISEKRRQDTVECFQNGMFDVMLLSTGAGGVGLTLTRASRVIVYDPSWNPSQDAQAVDRAYRIGQTQEVRVYRLFLAGSIEEKMYEKQVHKSGLEKTIFTEGNPETRYFDKHELCKVFAQVPDGSCELLKRFEKEGVAQVPDAHRHVLVRAHNSVVGISNHSNIYGKKRKNAFADAPRIDAKRFKAVGDVDSSEETATTTESMSGVVVSEGEGSAKDTSGGVLSEGEGSTKEVVVSEGEGSTKEVVVSEGEGSTKEVVVSEGESSAKED